MSIKMHVLCPDSWVLYCNWFVFLNSMLSEWHLGNNGVWIFHRREQPRLFAPLWADLCLSKLNLGWHGICIWVSTGVWECGNSLPPQSLSLSVGYLMQLILVYTLVSSLCCYSKSLQKLSIFPWLARQFMTTLVTKELYEDIKFYLTCKYVLELIYLSFCLAAFLFSL